MTPYNITQLASLVAMIAIMSAAGIWADQLKPSMWVFVGWLAAGLPLTLGYILTTH